MIRKIARPMLASVFVMDGVDTLRKTPEHVAETESVLAQARKLTPAAYAAYIPNDPELVARALGASKVGAGSLLAMGKAPRTSAAVLALTTLPNLLGRNAFWDTKDAEEKAARRNGFLTNTALLGALFITTQDTEGKPSLAWRAQKAGQRTNRQIQKALPTKSESQKMADEFSNRASDFSSKATDWFDEATTKAQAYVDDNKGDWEKTGRGLLDSAKSYVDEAKGYVDENKGDWENTGLGLLGTAKAYVNEAVGYVGDNKNAWLSNAQDNAKLARKGAVKAATRAQSRAEQAALNAEAAQNKRSAKRAAKRADKLQLEADKALERAYLKYGERAF